MRSQPAGRSGKGRTSCWVRFWTLVTGSVLLAAVGHAQHPTFRSTTELVNLNVTVTDRREVPVEGLTPEQFQVYEDGVPQSVEFFAPGSLPLDVVILLDTSGSMLDSMGLVQQAAIRFARALRSEDRATVMTIASGLRVVQPFTHEVSLVEAAIAQTRPGGNTPFYSSLYTTLFQLERERREFSAPRRQAIVVLSDGLDTSRTFTFDHLLEAVRQQGVPIYAIAPRPTRADRLMREQMFGESLARVDFKVRTLATESGARAFFPTTIHELEGIYGEIARELAHQYSLGYHSTNPTRDGSFRRIALKIDAPNLRWRVRSGYIAERDAATVAEIRD